MRWHPRLLDAGLAVLIAVVNGPVALRGAGAVAVVLYAVVHVPLIWRRAAPVAVCWTVFGLIVLTVLLVGVHVEGLYPEMVVVVAVYSVARYASRRQLVPVLAAVTVPAVLAFAFAEQQWTVLGFVVAVLAATVLAGTVVRIRQAYTAELVERARRLERERDQQAEIATAAERARIARDMHDIVAHNLTVMVALADGAALTATAAPEQAVTAMRHVSETGRQALAEMRRVLGVLHGGTPAADLDTLVAGVRAAGLPVTLTIDGVAASPAPGPGLAVYRIVQEALTNVMKHAGPGCQAHIRIRYRDDTVTLEVDDDGPSAPLTAAGPVAGSGHGIAGMAQRAAAYGGTLTAGPRPDRPGWRVRATLREDGPA